jgi:hypothetical protein
VVPPNKVQAALHEWSIQRFANALRWYFQAKIDNSRTDPTEAIRNRIENSEVLGRADRTYGKHVTIDSSLAVL